MNLTEQYIQTSLPIKSELIKIFSKEYPKVIFDIGACDGIDSVRYSRLFESSTVEYSEK
jgi:hypothetical protein